MIYRAIRASRFITHNDKNYDWYFTGSSSTDNTRWQSSKTIYDPCPPGWRVPDGRSSGVWSTALDSSSDFKDIELYDITKEGINFSGKFGAASTIWYPASGSRNAYNSSNGSLTNPDFGSYWSVTTTNHHAYFLDFKSDGSVGPSDYTDCARGYSVRCLQITD